MITPINATEAVIKPLIPTAMMNRGQCTDLDVKMDTGYYYTSAATVCANPPDSLQGYWQYAVVEVFNRYGMTFQRITCQKGCVQRHISQEGKADPWITLGAVSS